MTAVPAPNAKEVQEFQFKLLARLRLFKENPNLPLKQSLSLVAVSAKYGLICVGTPNGFEVIETAKIVEQCGGVKKPAAEVTDFPRRSVGLGAQPTHLDISCDGQHLAVDYTAGGTSIIRIYDVTSLASQKEQMVNEVRLPAPLRALSWNPGIPNLLAACMQDGSAAVYEFKNNSFEISSIPAEAYATCLCWSPKGKQIVIGSRNGSLNQFKPDLKIVKTIPPPQGDVSLVSVQWLSSLQYAAVYCTQNSGTGPNLVIVNTPRNQPITYINYEDITYSNGDSRLTQFYFIHQQTWNVLLVGSANSMEVGVLGLQGEWEQWQLEDAARAELPLSPSKQETHPVGMAMDTSVQYNLPWGENQHLPPMPLLLLLSHEGVLTLYWTVNLLSAATVCVPPNPLPDTSGLQLVTSQPVTSQPAISQPAILQPAISQQPQLVAASPPAAVAQPVPFAAPTPAPAPVAAPAAAPAPAPAYGVTSIPQWQQPPPTSQPAWIHTSALTSPKPEIKQPTSVVPGSWMASTSAPPAFISSLTQSAFSSASPAFNITSSTPAPVSLSVPAVPAFSVLPTSAPTAAPGITPAASPVSQTPFSFASLQASDSYGKPGAFVSSSVPTAAPLTPVSTVPVTPPSAKVDSTVVPSPVPSSPVSRPSTPEQEQTEESQELKAMNDALMEEAMKEEISHLNQELFHLSQRVRNINLNALNDERLENLIEGVNNMSAFMKELKETTVAQEAEVDSLRSFLLEAFAYVENMRARIKLQNNPDYMSIQSPQGLDPLQARKMADIRRNIQFIESQLAVINRDLSLKWTTFQESNKENRETVKIPSLEAIYQAMVLQNNVLMGQKKKLDSLEKEARNLNRKRLIKVMNVSRSMDDAQPDNQDTEFSKITQDFLSLNLSKLKSDTSVEDLQKSISSLEMSGHNIYLPKWKPVITPEKMEFLKEAFAGTEVKYLDVSSLPRTSFKVRRGPNLPFGTSTPVTGSISSGQPINQSISTKSSVEVGTVIPTANKTASPNLQQSAKPSDKSKPNSCIISNSKVSATSSIVGTSKTTTAQNIIVDSSTIAKQDELLSQSIKISGDSFPKKEVESKNIPKTTSTVSDFVVSSSKISSPQITTQQSQFTAFSLNTTKGLPFTSFTPSQQSSSFSLNQTSTPFPAVSNSGTTIVSTQSPASVKPQPFTTVNKSVISPPTVSASSGFPSLTTFGKNDPSKTFPLSPAVSFPCNIASTENNSTAEISAPTSSTTSNPLSSLSSLVSGIEPLKPYSGLTNSQNKVQHPTDTNTPKTPPNQPFVFKVVSASESKSPGKETSPNTSVFGFSPQIKHESKELAGDPKESNTEVKAQFSGAFTKLSNDPISPKSVFGKTSQGSGLEIEKTDPMPKNIFSSSNTPPKNLFGGNSVASSFSQKDQKTIFGGLPSAQVVIPELDKLQDTAKSGYFQSENASPVIEVSLNPPKSATDTKSALDKLTEVKGISITKVDLSEKKSPSVDNSETGNSTTVPSMKVSLNASSFTTPTKSVQNIFGGTTTPVKPSVMYEVGEPNTLAVSSSEPKEESKSAEPEKQPEVVKPQNLFGGVSTPKTSPIASFSFSSSTLQSTSSAGSTQTPPQSTSSGFSFGLKLTTETTTSPTTPVVTATQVPPSTFSFAAAANQPSSTAFSFTVPTTSASTNASSTFGFGNLSTGFSEEKSKTGFSFGEQAQNPASTEANIFGGFSAKSTEVSNIFGQSSTGIGDSKNVFGQTPSSTTSTKPVFGQTPVTTEEKKSVFGPITVTSAVSNPEFGFNLSISTASTQPSMFGGQATTTASFFGQPICSPTSTASSPFGQPSIPAFGNTTSSPFGGTTSSVFGSKPTFGQSGGSFFGQTSGGFGSSGTSVFGGNSSSTGSSLFGSSTSQPASPFGQSSGGSVFGVSGSFSAGGQTVGQTGFGSSAFQNKPAAFGSTSPSFGAAPSFGGAPTFGGSAAFGSPTKVFGGSPTAPSAFGGGATQQSATFGNLATQNTMTFGNLAQNQQQGFGSVFPPAQSNTPAPAFPPTTSTSMFGGSSFSSWR